MLEIPESHTIANQMNKTIRGKVIRKTLANSSPHRFAFYFRDPANYPTLISSKTIGEARAYGGFVEIEVDDARMLFNDGVNIRYFPQGEPIPAKHQLHIEFADNSSLVCTVQMYGGLWVYHEGLNDNKYYLVARQKPSPLTDEFNEDYFRQLVDHVKPTLSLKAFLATDQRIPGLGNGVLQDILFNARIHPRRTLEKLLEGERTGLYKSIKQTLHRMTDEGGRDTEKDIFGCNGGYKTIMSNRRLDQPCPGCGGSIVRQSYMGGNVYFCPNCQPL
jgi:formamidopyrimidine-DNA glycosylase